LDGDLKFIATIGLGGKNGEEYAGLIKTPSLNLMLDK
jgi:hypothetical protein